MFCWFVVFILEGIFFTQTNILIHFPWFMWSKWFGISDLPLYYIRISQIVDVATNKLFFIFALLPSLIAVFLV